MRARVRANLPTLNGKDNGNIGARVMTHAGYETGYVERRSRRNSSRKDSRGSFVASRDDS